MKRFDVDISIERLSKFKPKGRKFNRKVMPIPFATFRMILVRCCFDIGITLYRVDAYHTSKRCTHGGAANMGHVKGNYALYRCTMCDLTMNSDRKASLAVAVQAFLERNGFPNQNSFQISGRRVPASGLVRFVSDAAGPMAVSMQVRSRGKPTGFSRG